jgi:hypothetical protein
MNRVIILAAFLLSFMGIAYAQMGIKFDNCPGKEEFQNVKEFKEYGETFTSAEISEKGTRLKTIFTFYDGKLVRVKMIRSDNVEWSEDLAHRAWKNFLAEDKIISREDHFDEGKIEDGFIVFNGKNKSQMVLGRGKYKSSFVLDSSTMTALDDKYILSQVSKRKKSADDDDDQYQPLIRLPWQKRVTKEEYMSRVNENRRTQYITYPDGGTGFISPTGAVYGPNGQMNGQIINQ